MCPAPKSNGLALPSPDDAVISWRDVVMSADLTTVGDQVGCAWRISAATPATCGVDIDVPLRYAKFSPGVEYAESGENPARMFTPGAVTSGFKTSGTGAGPRAENVAISLPVSLDVSRKLLSRTTVTSTSASISAR